MSVGHITSLWGIIPFFFHICDNATSLILIIRPKKKEGLSHDPARISMWRRFSAFVYAPTAFLKVFFFLSRFPAIRSTQIDYRLSSKATQNVNIYIANLLFHFHWSFVVFIDHLLFHFHWSFVVFHVSCDFYLSQCGTKKNRISIAIFSIKKIA